VCQRLLADQGAGHRRDPYQRPAAPAALRRGDPGQPHPGQQPATHGCLGIGNGLVASLTWAVGPSAAPPPPTTSPTPTCSTSSGSRAPTQRLQHRRIEMTVVWCACRPLRGVGRVDMVAVSRRVQTLLFSDIVGSRTAFGIWGRVPGERLDDMRCFDPEDLSRHSSSRESFRAGHRPALSHAARTAGTLDRMVKVRRQAYRSRKRRARPRGIRRFPAAPRCRRC
jgi:hypothetical protein